MAQYYQIVGQPTMSLEDLRQFYPNITCIESAGGVQYVINNQDEGGAQFESQQVLLSTDQQILLNSTETQQIIIDQSQIQYTQQTQQYSVQDNEIVADYQHNEVVVNNQQQIYYTSPKQHIIQQSPQAPILAQQLTQPQIPTQQIMNNTPRVVTQHATPAIRQMVPQINNAHLMGQRRAPVPQNQPATLPTRTVQPNVRVQYALQEQQDQNQQLQMNQDDNQMVLNEGRVMTLGQFKQELAQNQQENHQTVITNQVQQNCVDKPQYKAPPPKRNYKRTNNGRGGIGGGGNPRARGRGAQPQQQSPNNPKPFQQQSTNSPKPFQQAQQQSPNNPKPFQQVQQQVAPPQPPQQPPLPPQQPPPPPQQQKPMQQYPGSIKMQARAAGMQQQPRGPIMQHPNIQHRQIQQQQQQQQSPNIIQQQQFQPQNNRVQPLIPLSPIVHNGHIQQQQPQQQQQQQQSPAYSPPNSQGQQQYLDDSSSSMSDEYRDSARMLVCLENGEQRLITFTLPKESCTVQDLLEQVGVPFKSDTKIECISNPGSDIDYIVYVGAVNNSPFPMDAQQVLTVDSLGDTQECIVSQSGAVIPVSERDRERDREPQKPPPPPPIAPAPPPEPPAEPELPPEPPKLIPRFVPGCLAVCNHCGYLSEDFNRCQRCKTRLPEDVKSISLNKEKAAENEKKTAKIALPPKSTPPPKTTVVTTPIIPNTKPPAKNTRGKRKAAQELEPVVLTLSSDEEDDAKPPTQASSKIDNAVTLSAIQKEPVIPADCDMDIDQEFAEGIFGGCKEEDILKSNVSLLSTTLPCRTVRIGSYRFVPREEISLTSLGVKIAVPEIVDPTDTYYLFIPMKYIIKVLGNFNKALPVLFFYVTPSVGALIRKNLRMEEGSDLYFDPLSKQEPFKRITLLPDSICDDTKAKIKDIYLTTPYKMLEELTSKEANDILIRTCPREGVQPKAIAPVVGYTTEMRQLVIYPPGKGGIAINTEDYMCLAQDQFLNDVIIDFYLKYLVTDVLAPSMQERVYIFSSFFYKRLTTKPTKASKFLRSNPFEVDSSLTPAEKRHCRVKSWTKGVNIFEKDYVIIPINENSHWFLAIICYPGLDGCRSMIDSTKVIKVPTKEKKKVNTITIGNTTISALKDDKTKVAEKPIKCDDEEGSDRDEAEGDESELEESENESDLGEQPPEKKSNQREPIKQPCILIFDSLAGASRSRVVATLRDYLTWEHRTKLHSNKTFNKDNIKGACPKVPQQMNFTDCGLYVLQYVESFFKDPITDYHIPIKMLKTWFEEIVVTRKREDLSNLIKELMIDNKKDPSLLPDIQFPTLNGELVGHMDGQFEGEEGEADMEEEEEEELSQNSEKIENSLTQISTMYNSDSNSESPGKSTETNAAISSTSNFTVSNVSSSTNKPDLSETSKNSRDTMLYLKSKRIIRPRHRTQEMNDNKKQKME